MLQSALVATGHGYEAGSMGRCDAFDRFEILANPLGGFDAASRASRVFRRETGNGTCYGSHALYLMRRADAKPNDREFYVAVHHGAGRQVWKLDGCFRYGPETVAALLAMPERALYSVLYAIVDALDDTRRATQEATAAEWRRATVDKRVKVSRQPSKGRAFVWIEPEQADGESEQQHELRKAWAKPSGVR